EETSTTKCKRSLAAPLLIVRVTNIVSIRAACVAMNAYLNASNDSSSDCKLKAEAETLSVKIWSVSVKKQKAAAMAARARK
ncbi:UNVERIFIED_CONTAM: hypothetical protein HDU68_003616, partial [Siphonaria sp. JEL0065]